MFLPFYFNWSGPLMFCMIELISRYGYLTNTKVKFIMVTTDLDVRDADVRNVSTIMDLQFSTAV